MNRSKAIGVVRILGMVFFMAQGLAFAQEGFPSRAIQIIVPNPPGGVADLHARYISEAMQKFIKQPVVVVNKPGAGGAVGCQYVATSKADGYTLAAIMPSFFIHPQVDVLFGRTPTFRPEQFRPVARLSADPYLLVVHAESPWKSFDDLVADAKRRPTAITFGSAGLYSGTHFSMEFIKNAAGITIRHVPYLGTGPSTTALLGRHVDTMTSGPGPLMSQLKGGTLRALGITSSKRLAILSGVPTFKEMNYDVETYQGVGLVVRKETPSAAMQVLRDAVRQAVKTPDFMEAMGKIGTEVAYLDEEEYYVEAWQKENRMFGDIIKRLGKLE
jgi:tripartite-type tricarboxylate transporter receptor subunit TctC